ncbi:MAG: prolyl oligopeptidase family serine peptidase [Candidatus Eiseniibacteriota bacterium]
MYRPVGVAIALASMVLLLPSGPGAAAGKAPSASTKAPAVPLPTQPKAPKHPVVDTYWGVKVTDDYQYMEKSNDPETEQWARGQNAYARAWLDRHPERKAILDRVTWLTHTQSPNYYSASFQNGKYFFLKEQPPKQQPLLVVLTSISDLSTERPVVDPNAIDSTGATTFDFYVPSPDGRYVAVSLSKGGTEDGTLFIYDTATGRQLDDVIPGVNGGTGGGSATWNADASGVYYTRYPRAGERPAADLPFYVQIYFHKLGTPVSADTYVLGRGFPKIAEYQLSTSPDGKWILADVSNGDGGEHAYWLCAPGGAWTQITRFEDGVVEGTFGMDGAVYLLSRADAPLRKILRMSLATPTLDASTVVVPETDNAIEGYTPTMTRIYVTEMVGGPTQVHVYDLEGRSLGIASMPEIASVGTPVRTSGDDVLVRSQSYTHPPAYYRLAANDLEFKATPLAQTSAADFSDCEVRRVFAPAEDGAKIPVNILMKKGTTLDGHSPALLYAYGAYGLSENPYFDPALKAWIEQGGIYADASVRGGGEYGEKWHQAARLGTKKVSMDDFAACARYLVRAGYTTKERLAIEGGSAGGLLVYGTVVHHPDAMEVAIAHVGYGDVLRTELSPNGEFNTTEFGTVRDSVQFRGMAAYSPYHHVQDGKTYPSILALTGVNDPRVNSWESYKMVARLQGSGSPNTVLMRVSYDSGHIGSPLSEESQKSADVYMFLFDRLGVKYQPVRAKAASPKAGPSL